MRKNIPDNINIHRGVIKRKTLSYKGDGIKFQNGFDAFQHMNNSCVYDGVNEKLLDVIVEPIE